ncbi:MAG: response regulator transcription factor [Bacteroidales bacterium]|nr:response regulator transcription factor [Bacteroidales bacterium]
MNIKCIVVDDEPLAIDKIKEYISRIPYLELLASFDNAIDALEFLRDTRTDLVFLDIQMEKFTGIQLLEILRNPPKIIITSAYDNYAVKGYELDVTDYLLKPISFERFLKAVTKVSREIRSEKPLQPAADTAGSVKPPADYIFIKADYHMHKVKLENILYIEGMKDYLRLHLPNERIMTLMSFMKMEKILPPDRFMRVHKSYIISLDKIERIERNTIMISGQKIPIGNKYKKEFLDYLEKEKVF